MTPAIAGDRVLKFPAARSGLPFAILLGLTLETARGPLALFVCGGEQIGGTGFFSPPPGPDTDFQVTCPRCETSHSVVHVADALRDGCLEVEEGGVGLGIRELLQTLHEAEESCDPKG